MTKISICVEIPESVYRELRTLTLANGGDWDHVAGWVLQAGLSKFQRVCAPTSLTDHQEFMLRKAELDSMRASQEQLRELFLGAMRYNYLLLNQIKMQMRVALGVEVEHG